MAWTLTEDLDEYVAAAGGFLRSRRCQGTAITSQAPLVLSGIGCVPLLPLGEQVPEP
jgi:hypothetical protein